MKRIIFVAAFLALLATAVTAFGSMPILAMAAAGQGSNGLETADQNVHSNTPGGLGGQQDVNFHVGTCQGGHTTAVLNTIGGCAALPSPSELGSGHNGGHP